MSVGTRSRHVPAIGAAVLPLNALARWKMPPGLAGDHVGLGRHPATLSGVAASAGRSPSARAGDDRGLRRGRPEAYPERACCSET